MLTKFLKIEKLKNLQTKRTWPYFMTYLHDQPTWPTYLSYYIPLKDIPYNSDIK